MDVHDNVLTEDRCRTETDCDTAPPNRKRPRRVSFVDCEVTSVHIFKRDEDYDTPPEQLSESANEPETAVLGFFRHLVGRDEKEEEESYRETFLRPIEFPSPGSSIVCSAKSNEEENFFGPVSANFIKPGRLSDSVASDVHDVTMDSKSFSMHYRSLMTPESADLNTSATVSAEEHEKRSLLSSPGSPMVMTYEKKMIPHSPWFSEKMKKGCDSSEMSLLGDKSLSYDYARLSPSVEAILAEAKKRFCTVHVSSHTPCKHSDNKFSTPAKDHKADLVAVGCANESTRDIMLKTSSDSKFAADFEPEIFNDRRNTIVRDDSEGCNDSGPDGAPYSLSRFPSQLTKSLSTGSRGLVQDVHQNANEKSLGGVSAKLTAVGIDSFNEGRLVSISGHESGHYPTNVAKDCNGEDSDTRKLLSGVNSCSQFLHSTPSRRQPSCFSSGHLRSISNELSFHKTMKQNALEPFSFVSSVMAGIHRSKERLSKLQSSAATPFLVADGSSKAVDDGNSSLKTVISNPKVSLFSENRMSEEDVSFNDDVRSCSKESFGKLNTQERTEKVKQNNELEHHMPNGLLVRQFDSLRKDSQSSSLLNKTNTIPAAELHLHPITESWSKSLATHVDSMSNDSGVQVQDIKSGGLDGPLEIGKLNYIVPDVKFPSLVAQETLFDEEDSLSGHSAIEKDSVWDTTMIDRTSCSYHCNNTVMATGQPQEGNGTAINSCSSGFCSPLARVSNAKNFVNDSPQCVSDALSCKSDSVGARKYLSLEKESSDKALITSLEHPSKLRKIEGRPNDLCSVLNVFSSQSGCVPSIIPSNELGTKDLNETVEKLSSLSNIVLPSAINGLHVSMINQLHDVIMERQDVKTHLLTISHCQFQRTRDISLREKRKRVADVVLLLYKFVYEKAKLKLLAINVKKLQRSSQKIRSAISEMEELRSLVSVSRSKLARKNIVNKSSISQKSSAFWNDASSEELASMTHEILDKTRTGFLSQGLGLENKIYGGDETAVMDNNKLKRRACQLLRGYVQLWKLDSVDSHGNQHNIGLNYSRFFRQRFMIFPARTPCIYVSIDISEKCISEHFPNMCASVAFTFALKPFSEKYICFKSLCQETQIVSLHLQNILDVVEEIQFAQVKSRTVFHTRFLSSVDQLFLELSFADMNRGGKMTLTLDMNCLVRGVYPADVVPCDVQFTTPMTQEPFVTETRAALARLSPGFSRLFRICMCISDMIESLNASQS